MSGDERIPVEPAALSHYQKCASVVAHLARSCDDGDVVAACRAFRRLCGLADMVPETEWPADVWTAADDAELEIVRNTPFDLMFPPDYDLDRMHPPWSRLVEAGGMTVTFRKLPPAKSR